MKYKIFVVCMFSMLMISSAFVGASGINLEKVVKNESEKPEEGTTSDISLSEFGEPFIAITDPEIGYLYLQYACDVEPLQLGFYEILETLSTAWYISLCPQLFIDTYFRDLPDGCKAKFSMETWVGGEQFEAWDNDLSDGCNVFFDLSGECQDLIKIFVYINVKIYDPDGDLVVSDTLPNSVTWMCLDQS